jgi:hypothetical protein
MRAIFKILPALLASTTLGTANAESQASEAQQNYFHLRFLRAGDQVPISDGVSCAVSGQEQLGG